MSMLKFRYPAGFIVAAGLLAAMYAADYYSEDLAEFEAARSASTEQYLQMELGSTRYQVVGNEADPVVVLVHSFNGFLESWAPNIEPLVKAGFRVVTYDLWGRGLSDRPRVDLSLPVFRRQLDAVIAHVGASTVHLVGASFGCVVASDYALENPDRVEKLVLVGPSGWPAEGNGTSALLNIPVVGDVVFHYFGVDLLLPKVEAYLYDREAHDWAVESWNKFASFPGFTRSALSTLRHSPVLDYTEGWRRLGALGKPTLFIWGRRDISFPYANAARAAALIPHAEIVGVEGAAHWVNIEQPAQVNAAMAEFLAQ